MAKQDSFFSFSSLSKMASFGGFGIFGNLATADFTPLPNSPSDKLFHYGDMLGRAYHAGDYSEVKMHLPEIKDTFLDFAGSMLPVVGPVGTASKVGAAGIRGMSSASGLLRAGNRLSQTRTFVNLENAGGKVADFAKRSFLKQGGTWGTLRQSPVSKVANLEQQIGDWLGKDLVSQKPKKGSDLILRSKDGSKQIRFDLTDPHGLDPHINIETFKPRNLYPGDQRMTRLENFHPTFRTCFTGQGCILRIFLAQA